MSTMGIYKITHTSTGRIYIGQSVNIQHRWWVHGAKGSECVKLRNAIQKYGRKEFKLIILEVVSDVNNLTEREQYYLDILQPFGDNGFNICTIASKGPCVKGIPKTGLLASGATNMNNTPVCAYDDTGKLVERYYSVTHAANMLAINKAGIFAVLAGRARTAGGFFWARPSHQPVIRDKISVSGRTRSPETIQKMKEATKQTSVRRGKPALNRRSVLALNEDTVELEFPSIKEAAVYCNVTSAAIFNSIKHGHKTCGYKWCYNTSS